jgi:hypothetical protein
VDHHITTHSHFLAQSTFLWPDGIVICIVTIGNNLYDITINYYFDILLLGYCRTYRLPIHARHRLLHAVPPIDAAPPAMVRNLSPSLPLWFLKAIWWLFDLGCLALEIDSVSTLTRFVPLLSFCFHQRL